ncbi:MAG: hypothetical protein KI791_01525 [Cyclobacteriaceae bacterium]|nr:hypothetical protein [Cyclobacteriaceae bacterium SS2]
MHFVADKILEAYGDQLDFVFLELLDIENPKIENLYSLREYYYLTPALYFKTLAVLYDQKYKKAESRIRTAKIYTQLFIQGFLNIGTMETFLSRKNEFFQDGKVGVSGFLPIDLDSNFERKRNMLFKDTLVLEERKLDAIKHIQEEYPNDKLTAWYVDYIEKAKAKGVHVVVVMAPRITQYVMSTYNDLPPQHKIRVSDPIKYPELYLVENSADAGHLNAAGARIFTREVARAFNQLNLD